MKKSFLLLAALAAVFLASCSQPASDDGGSSSGSGSGSSLPQASAERAAFYTSRFVGKWCCTYSDGSKEYFTFTSTGRTGTTTSGAERRYFSISPSASVYTRNEASALAAADSNIIMDDTAYSGSDYGSYLLSGYLKMTDNNTTYLAAYTLSDEYSTLKYHDETYTKVSSGGSGESSGSLPDGLDLTSGTWTSSDAKNYITFASDGTASCAMKSGSDFTGTWSVSGSVLTLSMTRGTEGSLTYATFKDTFGVTGTASAPVLTMKTTSGRIYTNDWTASTSCALSALFSMSATSVTLSH